MALKLRPYQETLIDKIREKMNQGSKRILVVAPTGSGKTAMVAHMLGTASNKGLRSVFNVHRRELIKQSIEAFYKAEVRHGIIANSFVENTHPLCQIASVQTLARRLNKYRAPRLCIWDECHHIAAGQWKNIFNAYRGSFHIGVTATPERLDGKGLREWFDCMIEGPSVSELIEEGWLSPYKLYAPQKIDMTGVHKRMGDYNISEAEELIDKPTITGSAINEYKKLAEGKRAVVFCLSIKHSVHVAEQFKASGVPAIHVDGNTPVHERDRAIELFESGQVKVLCNVDLFGEGFDLPAIEAAILLRPTQSLSLYLQQVGRSLRPAEGKTHAIILDHVGNWERHGLPDQKREWSLDGRAKVPKGQKAEPSIRVCEKCYAAQPPGRSTCIYCDHEFVIKHREIAEVDGELAEVNATAMKAKRKNETWQAKSLEELYQLGLKRGYKHPRQWAKHMFNARQQRKLQGR